MLQDKITLMLTSLANNRKAFQKFYKTGYFSYKDESFEGAVAIVNDKAVISFLQDADDELKAIATASFQDSSTFTFKLSGDKFSQYQFGQAPYIGDMVGGTQHTFSRDKIINEISSVRRHCAEARRKSTSAHKFIGTRLIENLKHLNKNLSKQEVSALIENTINKLNRSRHLSERDEISPRVNISDFSHTDISISPSNSDKTR